MIRLGSPATRMKGPARMNLPRTARARNSQSRRPTLLRLESLEGRDTPAPVPLDPSFDCDGKVITQIGSGSSLCFDVAIDIPAW
jgi:hypothetical protein